MKPKPKTRSSAHRKDVNRYPRGLNRQKVQGIIDHYENQSESEAVAEDEAAFKSTDITMMGIPVALVPKVQKIISRRSG